MADLPRRLAFGSDHGGYEVRGALVERIRELGVEVVDVGSDTEEIVRYPHYALKVAGMVAAADVDRGVLVCSTGIGMSIAANKVRGVRAALCTSAHMARMTRQHNDSNVLCLGGKITGLPELLEMVGIWLSEAYIGGRHDISLGLITPRGYALDSSPRDLQYGRAMGDYPRTLQEFEDRFATEEACREYLAGLRWRRRATCTRPPS